MGREEDGFCYDEIKLGSDPIHPFRAGEESFIEDRPPCACQSDHAIGRVYPVSYRWLSLSRDSLLRTW